MTRSEVFAYLMTERGATEQRLMRVFGTEVQEIVSSLHDLRLVCKSNVGTAVPMWYPVLR